MPLFSKKPKYALPEFCTAFYLEVIPDTQPHNVPGTDLPMPEMSDINRKTAEFCVGQVSAVDSTFADVEPKTFATELGALRLEAFALAWAHSFKDDKRVLGQATLLRAYLRRNRREDIWEAMQDYNQTIARSTQKSLPTNERLRRAAVVGQNSLRMSMMDTWTKAGIEGEVAAHAINLNFTEESWAKGFSGSLLVYALLRRIGKLTTEGDPLLSNDGSASLVGTVMGMYRDVKERIGRVDIVA